MKKKGTKKGTPRIPGPLDVKDQTTWGLQLLDDMSHHTLSGEHALIGDKVLHLKNRYNRELKNTNEVSNVPARGH